MYFPSSQLVKFTQFVLHLRFSDSFVNYSFWTTQKKQYRVENEVLRKQAHNKV